MASLSRLYNVGAHGFPPTLRRPISGAKLTYSNHAQAEALRENVYISRLPKALSEPFTLVEAQITGNIPDKWVIRMDFSSVVPNTDLVMVLGIAGLGDYFVRTLWLNAKDDNHRTFDTRKYSRP